MSEHQTYEFLAIDRPLSQRELAALRAISSRAEITSTRFYNEYDWGDLKADPVELMRRYFDAHLYTANWGTRRLMLRLPRGALALKEARRYAGDCVRATQTKEHLLLDVCADFEGEDPADERVPSLELLASLRDDLLRGDRRPLYLAWLLSVPIKQGKSRAAAPEVPAGLNGLSRAQRAFADFLPRGRVTDWRSKRTFSASHSDPESKDNQARCLAQAL